MGNHPVEAVKAMSMIITETEKTFKYEDVIEPLDLPEELHVAGAICGAATHLSYACDENAFLVVSYGGRSVKLLSKHRPQSPIFAYTFNEDVYNRMAFYHNVYPILLTEKHYNDEGILYFSSKQMKNEIQSRGHLNQGDSVIMLRGTSETGCWRLAHIKMETI